MPKPDAFLKKEEAKPMDAGQWRAFASNVLGRPLKLKPAPPKN